MSKQEILNTVSMELYSKYEAEIKDAYASQEEFFESIKDIFTLFLEKYNPQEDEKFEDYIRKSLEDDLLTTLGLTDEEIEIDVNESELDESEKIMYKTYEDKYKNIEKIISQGKGSLEMEEKDILAAKNIPLIHSIVKKFANTGIEYSELLSTGYVGYAKALDTYQKGKNVKFSTYAYRCIKNEILYFLRREKRHKDNDVSLYKPISTDKNGNVMTVDSTISNVDMGERTVEEDVEMSETVKILLEIIDTNLNENEAYIIKNRYGLGNIKPKTQKEIADEINMSQANVSKLEKGINDKIKKIMSSKYKIKNL